MSLALNNQLPCSRQNFDCWVHKQTNIDFGYGRQQKLACCQNHKVIKIKETDDLSEVIKESLKITHNILVQNYDKEWDEWVDVSSFADIPKRTILRCLQCILVLLPQTSIPSAEVVVNNDASLDDTVELSSETDISLETGLSKSLSSSSSYDLPPCTIPNNLNKDGLIASL